MELGFYIALLAFAFILMTSDGERLSNALFLIIVWLAYVSTSVVIRLSGFDVDIITYAEQMRRADLSFYYLREPIIWFGQRLAYQVLQSEVLVFVTFDIGGLALVFLAFRNFGMPRYAYIAFLLFFPTVLGMQNVYRQWYSACFLLYAASHMTKPNVRSALAIIAGIASHNVAAIFLGYFAVQLKTRWQALILLLSLLFVPIAIYYGGGTKSGIETGASMEFAYLGLISLVGLVIVFSHGREASPTAKREKIAIFYIVYLVGVAIVLLASVPTERIALFALTLLYPPLVLAIENKFVQPRLPLRFAFTLLGFVPVLAFGTRQFIL